MILNRLTGLDLGQPPAFIIADNIKKAERLSTVPLGRGSDKRSGRASAENGDDVLGLARNLGEVFGCSAYSGRGAGVCSSIFSTTIRPISMVGPAGVDPQDRPEMAIALNRPCQARGDPSSIVRRRLAAMSATRSRRPRNRMVGVQTWKTPECRYRYARRRRLAWTGKRRSAGLHSFSAPLKETDGAFNAGCLGCPDPSRALHGAPFFMHRWRAAVRIRSRRTPSAQRACRVSDLEGATAAA
jgi:hypothetical protein